MLHLVPLVAALVGLMQPILADAPTGTVAGTVRDPGGTPCPAPS